MENSQPASYDASDYFATLRQRWWILALATVLGVLAALVVTGQLPKTWTSSTSVLVESTGASDTNVVGGRTKGEINLDTEAQLVHSTAVAAGAAALMKVKTAPDELADHLSVDVPANTSVLSISFTGGSAREAQAGSHAFAEAYLANRNDSAKADLNSQIAALEAKIKSTNAALTTVNNRIPQVSPNSSERNNLDSQRSNLNSQLNTLTSRMNSLSTTTISAGKIISDAKLPSYPTSPNRMLNLASGAIIGLLLGVGMILLLQRFDRRLRRGVDVTRRADLSVLAELPAGVTPHFDDVFPPYGSGGRTFNRLRNEVLASLQRTDQIVVVSGASRGTASTLVAANLAAALARTGSEVVLVCAHLPDSLTDTVGAPRLLGVRATPGLSDVLAGRVELSAAVQRAPRNPWLRVITTGGTASAAGLLQSQALREILAVLRSQAEYIVIEAPSTSASADAQSIASLGDAAILAVELRRTRHVEVADAAEQLRRVGIPVLGAVVLPRLRATGTEPPAPPAPNRPVETLVADEDAPVRREPTRMAREIARLERHPELAADSTAVIPRPTADSPDGTGLIPRIAADSTTVLPRVTADSTTVLPRVPGQSAAPGPDATTPAVGSARSVASTAPAKVEPAAERGAGPRPVPVEAAAPQPAPQPTAVVDPPQPVPVATAPRPVAVEPIPTNPESSTPPAAAASPSPAGTAPPPPAEPVAEEKLLGLDEFTELGAVGVTLPTTLPVSIHDAVQAALDSTDLDAALRVAHTTNSPMAGRRDTNDQTIVLKRLDLATLDALDADRPTR